MQYANKGYHEQIPWKSNPNHHIILDIDGVLTDGTIIIEPTGEQTRTMNIKDGFALQLAVKRGFKVAIISGGKNEIVKKTDKSIKKTN